MAVVAAAEYEGTIRAGTAVQRSAILDMWGPGAEVSHFSSLIQLVLILRLSKGLAEIDAHTAIQRAEYQLAFRLAELTTDSKPTNVEVFDLGEADPSLPSVVLIQGCLTHSHHPHELLDGAMSVDTTRGIGYYPTSWDWQNHPLVMGLYRWHRKRLNFAGMIVERIRFETHHGKEVIAQNTMRMAKALHADAALVSWLGSGNAFVDVMLTVQACERAGIKTVLVTYEYGGKDGVDSPLLYYVPEANAVVSTGSRDRWLELPPPDARGSKMRRNVGRNPAPQAFEASSSSLWICTIVLVIERSP
jgi:glycine reductase